MSSSALASRSVYLSVCLSVVVVVVAAAAAVGAAASPVVVHNNRLGLTAWFCEYNKVPLFAPLHYSTQTGDSNGDRQSTERERRLRRRRLPSEQATADGEKKKPLTSVNAGRRRVGSLRRGIGTNPLWQTKLSPIQEKSTITMRSS